MHDRASYATACAGASIGDAQPINDPLGLLPEHLNSITFKWNAHLIKQKISGNYLRILNAIYHQTIDFNKWEDDLAGKRLQQLTHIRYDHSNFIIKRLYERNIILKRKGSFGSIVSINFDFATWGKQYKQDEPHDANNDPTLLLSEEIRNNPIDGGMDLGLSDDFTTQPILTQKTIPENTNISTAKPPLKAKVIDPVTNQDTDKNDTNIHIEPIEKPHIKIIDPVTHKIETLEEVVEQEVLRFQSQIQSQKQQELEQLEAQVLQLEQRLAHQNTLEKQFVEQNQYIQTMKAQQAEKIAELKQTKQEAIAEFKQTEQATQEYTLQQSDLYDQKIAELKQSLQQQKQQAEQAAKEYAIQQQKEIEKTIQENAELQAKQARQQSEIAAYQAQIAQAETKIEAEYQAQIVQAEINPKTEQFDKSESAQQEKILVNTDSNIELEHQNNHPFIQAEFPIPPQTILHVSPTVVEGVTESMSNTTIDQSDEYPAKLDINQPSDNQAIPDLENLHYADNIPIELRSDIAKLLPEMGQQAQKLLDIFSAQLSNPNQPIQNPIVDFAHLVQRLQTGELDIEDTETLIARARGDKTPQQDEFERLFAELEETRHTADLNKQHYLDYYQREAEANQMSVEQYLEDQEQMDFWQELCSTLKQSEYAIRDLMVQNA